MVTFFYQSCIEEVISVNMSPYSSSFLGQNIPGDLYYKYGCYDCSMKSINNVLLHFILRNLLSTQGIDLHGWREEWPKCPQQTDSSSCGVFVIEVSTSKLNDFSVVRPFIVNDVPKSKLLISLWPYFAECQTFGPWKTIGLYAGLN